MGDRAGRAVFAGFTPVAPAPLRPGLWKLVGIGPGGNVEIESQVFRIDVCTGACEAAPKPDPNAAKQAFTAMYDSVKTTCQLSKALSMAKKAAEAKETYDEVVGDGFLTGGALGMVIVKVGIDVAGSMTYKAVVPKAVPYLPPAVGMSIWAMCKAIFGVNFPNSPIPFVSGPHVNVGGLPDGMVKWLEDPPQPYETVDHADFIDWSKFDTNGFLDPDGSFRTAKQIDRLRAFLAAGTTAWERFQGAYNAGPSAISFQHAQAAAVATDFSGLNTVVQSLAGEFDTLRAALQANGTYVDSLSQDELDTIGPVMRRVRDTGFTAVEIADLKSQGVTDAEIVQLRDQVGGDTDTLTTASSFVADLTGLSSNLRAAANALDDFATEAAFYAGRTNQPAVASFTTDKASGAAPLQVTFTSTSTSPDLDPLSLTWAFGDGDTATGASVTHTYAGGGTYTATLTASDGLAETTATKTISVSGAANQRPTPVDDVLTTTEGQAGFVDVLANDTDPDGDALTVSAHGTAVHGTVACDPGGVCTFTPTAGFTGAIPSPTP